MEAEPTQAEALPPRCGERVGRGSRRETGVERRVEAGNVRDLGQHGSGGSHRGHSRGLMEGGELLEGGDSGDRSVVDDDRVPELDPAMHDPVPNGIGPPQAHQRLGERCVAGPRRQVLAGQGLVAVAEQAQLQTA